MTDYEALVGVARARYKLACEEMDRLTAGSPGANWRWSIPANPARDSDLILSASAEDVPKLADAVETLLAIEQRLTDHIVQLAAERDALLEARRAERQALVHRINDYRAERDTLRTQLDGMTTEVHSEWKFIPMNAKGDEGRFSPIRVSRLVGPWVEVAETRGNVSTSKPADDHICDTDCHEDQYGIQWHTAEGVSDGQQ